MRLSTDWKFWLTASAAIAGVVVPVWLWRADLASKSLSLRIVSQTSLQPDLKGGKSSVSVTVDGQVLASPYLSVLELRNDGTRPIPASDFEGAIELKLLEPGRAVRSDLTVSQPKSLEATISTSDNSVSLKPLLLNPNDSLTFAVVTSGGQPKFLPKARIAGVSDLLLEDESKSRQWGLYRWLTLALSYFLFVAGYTTFFPTRTSQVVGLYYAPMLFVSVVCGTAGSLALALVAVMFDLTSNSLVALLAVGILFPAVLLGAYLNRAR